MIATAYFSRKSSRISIAPKSWSKYELTMGMLNNSTLFYPLGIYDIALPVLNLQQYEEKRIYKRTYIFSKYFEKCMKRKWRRLKDFK